MGNGHGAWLGRYSSPYPVRSVGAFHLVAAERIDGGGPRVVAVGGPRRDPAAIGAALAEAARVHSLLHHPAIPAVGELGTHEGAPFLELVCDGVVDGHEIVRGLADSGERLGYGLADAVFTQVREAMQAAHAVVDPRSGRPVCLGRLSLGNLLFSRTGSLWLVGFGHNLPLAKESGAIDGLCAVHQAAEVATGEPATPGADYVAVLLASRAHLSFADVAGITARLMGRGPLAAGNLELLGLVRYFDTEWIGQLPWARPTIEEGLRASARIREILGTKVDAEGLARRVAELVAELHPRVEAEATSPSGSRRFTVARDGTWVETVDGRRRLGAAHGRLLLALVEAHERGELLDAWTLLERGWPGEEPVAEAGANRVYVALTRLRQLGLRDALERAGGGFRIAPGTVVRTA